MKVGLSGARRQDLIFPTSVAEEDLAGGAADGLPAPLTSSSPPFPPSPGGPSTTPAPSSSPSNDPRGAPATVLPAVGGPGFSVQATAISAFLAAPDSLVSCNKGKG